MPRPNKILEPTKTYNLLMKQDQYDRLSKHAHEMQKVSLEQVAVADLIREAIDVYVEVLDEEQDEVEN
jgi:histidinol-phosphate/aromatic aminotransferase/cobyric acid decarboxylase-like protein